MSKHRANNDQIFDDDFFNSLAAQKKPAQSAPKPAVDDSNRIFNAACLEALHAVPNNRYSYNAIYLIGIKPAGGRD